MKLAALRHPLLLVTFGKAVVVDSLANGNLDIFLDRYPKINLFDYAKRAAGRGRTHILYFATRDLSELEERLLSLITTTDRPLESALIFGVVESEGYNAHDIRYALNNLSDKRQLIYASRPPGLGKETGETVYSMHPVYRLYWNRLKLADVRTYAANISENFENSLFEGYGRSAIETTSHDVDARILPVARMALTATLFARAWDILDPFLGSYERLGLFRTMYEIVTQFVSFDTVNGELTAKCHLSDWKQADKALFQCADLLRLFDEPEKALACAKAKLPLLNNHLDEKNERAANVRLLQAELEIALPLSYCVNRGELAHFYSTVLDRWHRIGGFNLSSHSALVTLNEATKSFGTDADRRHTAAISFALVHGWMEWRSGRSGILWALSTQDIWAELDDEQLLERYHQLWMVADADFQPRSQRYLVLQMFEHFVERRNLSLAQQLHEFASAMGGWGELDLMLWFEWQRLELAVAALEEENGPTEAAIDQALQAVDRYHHRHDGELNSTMKLRLTLWNLRLYTLAGSSNALDHLREALSLVEGLKLPLADKRVAKIVRCADALGGLAQARTGIVLGALPQRYEIRGLIPDPFFGFQPNPQRIASRPWRRLCIAS